MRTRKTIAMTALVAASTLALTACTDDEPGVSAPAPEATESSDATDEPTEATETTESEDTGAAPVGDVTAPGTELSLGDAATVPFESAGKSGTIQIVVDEIVKGAASDLDALDLGEQAKGYVPYYIKFTVTGVSGSADLAYSSVDESIEGVLPDGEKAQPLYVIGTWDFCDGESIPGDFADGSSFSSCVPYLAQEATSVAGAAYAPSDGDYNSFDGQPVVWK